MSQTPESLEDATTPDLAVIVVLYNSKERFLSLWDQLKAQSLRSWRLVLVDNASADGSGAAIQALDDGRIDLVLNSSNVGFARAVNQGVRRAHRANIHRYLLLNPDTFLTDNFLQQFLEIWVRNGWGIVVPRIMQSDDPTKAWYAGGHLDYGWVFQNRHDEYFEGSDMRSREVGYASGCCLGLTQTALDRIGLFDESFFMYWEDVDFCMRLNAANEPIHYVPELVILHEGAASSGGPHTLLTTYMTFRSYVILLRKHFGLLTTLTTIGRVLRREQIRTGAASAPVRVRAGAALSGLTAPLHQIPQL